MNKTMTTRPRRRYRLTPEGRQSLQQAIRKTRPWTKATGPKTAEGKARSSRNAIRVRPAVPKGHDRPKQVNELLKQMRKLRIFN